MAHVTGTCPICSRSISLQEDRTLRKHNRRAKLRKGQEPELCEGSGTQPLDQARIPVHLDSRGSVVSA